MPCHPLAFSPSPSIPPFIYSFDYALENIIIICFVIIIFISTVFTKYLNHKLVFLFSNLYPRFRTKCRKSSFSLILILQVTDSLSSKYEKTNKKKN